jgi:CheY-like chemotaxis protein
MMEIPPLKELQAVTSELNVLYVEDEEMIRSGLAKSLRQLFHSVEEAEDGAIGLDLFNNGEFDLIITDISMPNLNGIEMINAIKESDQHIPIIVTSAHNESDKLMELINLGVDRFLLKPVNRIALLDALFKLCTAITNKKKAECYKAELEQKVRILETKIKKEYAKAKKEEKVAAQQEVAIDYSDYFEELDYGHRDELVELNDDIDASILLAWDEEDINAEYAYTLSNHIRSYASILNNYPVFHKLGMSLSELAIEIEGNTARFTEQISVIRELLESFNFTLIKFRQQVWETKSSHPNFFDPSLQSDIIMIINVLENRSNESDIEFF